MSYLRRSFSSMQHVPGITIGSMRSTILALASTVLVAALLPGQSTDVASPAQRIQRGYLTAAEMPDVARVVPPAPSLEDPRALADKAIFRATRSLEGSARWALAQTDDDVSMSGLFKAFGCALGVTLTSPGAPKAMALLTRANADAGSASNLLKNLYQHKRPFQVDEGSVCLTARGKAVLEHVPDYPSGHATAGWETGLIFAELAPDAATGILARAREFGESRVVCGVHNASAVEAGWMTATAVFAVQQTSPAFRDDLEAARTELAALRAHASGKTASCADEAALLSQHFY